VYPYSVIRGGAYNATELIHALDRDSVAEQHYSVFRRRLVHTAAADFARPVYLSYRIGDAIYWTRRPVSVPRGEALLTDGENYARARCGNRISQNPQTPVNDTEPPPETLDTTEPPESPHAAGLDNWSDNRLRIELPPHEARVVPAGQTPVQEGSGTAPESTTPSWWISGVPPGFLSTGGAPVGSRPSTGGGTVIEPNPIAGLLLHPAPFTGFPSPAGAPYVPATPTAPGIPTSPRPPEVPSGPVPPPSVPLVPGTTPDVPTFPGYPGVPTTPLVPGSPSNPSTPSNPLPPDNPPQPTPEPAYLVPTVLALAAFAAARCRRGH
jgi:hypothetical protein